MIFRSVDPAERPPHLHQERLRLVRRCQHSILYHKPVPSSLPDAISAGMSTEEPLLEVVTPKAIGNAEGYFPMNPELSRSQTPTISSEQILDVS